MFLSGGLWFGDWLLVSVLAAFGAAVVNVEGKIFAATLCAWDMILGNAFACRGLLGLQQVFNLRLGRCEAGYRNPVRATAYIVEADHVAELHGTRVAAVFPAYAYLEIGADGSPNARCTGCSRQGSS